MEPIVDAQQAVTVVIKPCRSCSGPIPESDRFCRSCGESQFTRKINAADGALALRDSLGTGFEPASMPDASAPNMVDPGCSILSSRISATSISGAIDPGLPNHVVSGPVVWALSTTGGSLARVHDSKMRRIVSLLVSVPVWLIILLLSPFEAYAAARLITEARWQQERPAHS